MNSNTWKLTSLFKCINPIAKTVISLNESFKEISGSNAVSFSAFSWPKQRFPFDNIDMVECVHSISCMTTCHTRNEVNMNVVWMYVSIKRNNSLIWLDFAIICLLGVLGCRCYFPNSKFIVVWNAWNYVQTLYNRNPFGTPLGHLYHHVNHFGLLLCLKEKGFDWFSNKLLL